MTNDVREVALLKQVIEQKNRYIHKVETDLHTLVQTVMEWWDEEANGQPLPKFVDLSIRKDDEYSRIAMEELAKKPLFWIDFEAPCCPCASHYHHERTGVRADSSEEAKRLFLETASYSRLLRDVKVEPS